MRNNNDDAWPIALTKCYYCGESFEIILGKNNQPKTRKLVEQANGAVLDMTPCNKCKGYMDLGVVLITIDPDKTELNEDGYIKTENGIPNPYRTGGFFVLGDEAFTRIFSGEAAEFGLKHRWMFIDHETAVVIGLFETAKKEDKDNG